MDRRTPAKNHHVSLIGEAAEYDTNVVLKNEISYERVINRVLGICSALEMAKHLPLYTCIFSASIPNLYLLSSPITPYGDGTCM